MKGDEYDFFLDDSTDYTIRYLLPRAFTTLKSLAQMLKIGYRFIGFPFMMPVFTDLEFRKMARTLLKAGQEQNEWQKQISFPKILQRSSKR